MPKFVGQRKALALPPVLVVHHNDGHGAFPGATDASSQAVDIRQIKSKHFDSLFFQ